MTRTYELMMVLRSDYPADDRKKLTALIESFITQGTISALEILGKKNLAYPIKKQTEGVYVNVILNAAPLKVGDMEKEARMSTDILRYLLIAIKVKKSGDDKVNPNKFSKNIKKI